MSVVCTGSPRLGDDPVLMMPPADTSPYTEADDR